MNITYGVHEDDTAQAVDDGAEEIDVAGHLQVGTGPNAAKVAKTDVGRAPKKIDFLRFFFNCVISHWGKESYFCP